MPAGAVLLKRTAAETGQQAQDYNAGAASAQLIGKGDGWVEFEASENNLGHVVGLSKSCDGCSDSDPSLVDVYFGISLSPDGTVRVIEGGTFLTGPEPDGSYGTSVAGDRFRVVVTDNNDNTANISYYRVVGPCTPGMLCQTTLLETHSGPGGKTFMMISLTLLYEPFRAVGDCQGFRDSHKVSEVGVRLAGAVTFDVAPNGDFSIPKEKFLIHESFVDNKKAKTAYQKPERQLPVHSERHVHGTQGEGLPSLCGRELRCVEHAPR